MSGGSLFADHGPQVRVILELGLGLGLGLGQNPHWPIVRKSAVIGPAIGPMWSYCRSCGPQTDYSDINGHEQIPLLSVELRREIAYDTLCPSDICYRRTIAFLAAYVRLRRRTISLTGH